MYRQGFLWPGPWSWAGMIRRNTLAQDKGNTDYLNILGGHNQESGKTDRWHIREGKWPEMRRELLFKIKPEITRQKSRTRQNLTAVWQWAAALLKKIRHTSWWSIRYLFSSILVHVKVKITHKNIKSLCLLSITKC